MGHCQILYRSRSKLKHNVIGQALREKGYEIIAYTLIGELFNFITKNDLHSQTPQLRSQSDVRHVSTP